MADISPFSTTFTNATAFGTSRPFQSSTGNVYFCSGTKVYKATGTPSSFSDTGVAVTGLLLDVVQVSDVLHILSRSSTPGTFYYSTFNMATDALVISNESAYTGADNDAENGAIAVRSSGEVVIIFRGANFSSMGTPFGRLYYRIRSTGGVWGTATGFLDCSDDALISASTCGVHSIIPGTSGRLHFTYYETVGSTGRTSRTLTSANVLGTQYGFSRDWLGGSQQQYPYDYTGTTGGVSPVPMVERQFTSGQWRPGTCDLVSGDNVTFNNPVTADTTTIVESCMISYDGTTKRLIYSETTPKKLWYLTDFGGSWGSPVALYTGSVTGPATYGVNRFTRSGSERLAYTFGEGSPYTIYYGEVELSAGSTPTHPIERPRSAMATAVCRASSF